MRLLFVSHSFPPPKRPQANLGGMQRVATELHHELFRNPDVELSSVVLRTSSRWSAIRTLPFLWSAYRRIKKLAVADQIDAVIFSSMVTASLTVFLRSVLEKKGVRSFAIAHGDDVISPSRVYQRFLPRVFKALDVVLPVSAATKRACLERGAQEDKVIVVPNGIDPKRFAHDQLSTDAAKTGLGIPDFDALPADAFLLCSAGRHVARKGFGWFIANVMPLLPPNVHFWLIGSGGETSRIRQTIDEYKLGERVRLLGRISDAAMEAVYRRADLFVMPNIQVPGTMEGFGVVMLEAGLCGLPTIAARLEGIEDVIIEGENGHLAESGNPESFVDIITKYVRNRETLPALANRTKSTAMRFTWESIAAEHLQVIQRFS